MASGRKMGPSGSSEKRDRLEDIFFCSSPCKAWQHLHGTQLLGAFFWASHFFPNGQPGVVRTVPLSAASHTLRAQEDVLSPKWAKAVVRRASNRLVMEDMEDCDRPTARGMFVLESSERVKRGHPCRSLVESGGRVGT